MKLKTESGSVYEIDLPGKRVRKLAGRPTSRQLDGWKTYKQVYDLAVGSCALFMWPDDVPLLPGSPQDSRPATLTSEIVEITK